MRISFFEEFPTDDVLAPAGAVDFPATVFLAAHRLAEYEEAAARLVAWNPLCDCAYWPLLPHSYWLSPFANPDDIDALRAELEAYRGPPLKVLFDLELPLLQGKLFAGNAPRFFANKRKIRAMFEDFGNGSPIRIHTAEYPVPTAWLQRSLVALGVSQPLRQYGHTRIVMFYTSILRHPRLIRWVGRRLVRLSKRWGDRLQVGLGTVAPGVFGNEPILSPEELERDLTFLHEHGVRHVVIFRLGGLTEPYLAVLRRFAERR